MMKISLVKPFFELFISQPIFNRVPLGFHELRARRLRVCEAVHQSSRVIHSGQLRWALGFIEARYVVYSVGMPCSDHHVSQFMSEDVEDQNLR